MMEIDAIKQQIALKLTNLERTLPTESSVENVQVVSQDFAALFDDLFGDVGHEHYLEKLSPSSRVEDFQFYIDTLNALKNCIEKLPFEDEIKRALLGKIFEHISPNLLKSQVQEDSRALILKQGQITPLVDMIQIKTWGTSSDISDSLRHIAEHAARGEATGHTSMMMRIKADGDGKKLIEKYCLNEDGSIKIPFEVKHYGQDYVYEINWSFWPNGLKTADEDVRDEQANAEQYDDLETLKNMPLELKSRYLNQKYQASKIPTFLVPSSLKKPTIFASSVPNHRIMALPAPATMDVSTIEPDLFRRHYLELKLKQFQISDNLNSLKVLIENYLEKDASFSHTNMKETQSIEPASNFLLLLTRYKNELSEKQVIEKILQDRKISPEQSVLLWNDIKKVIATQEAKLADVHHELEESAQLIHEHQKEFDQLKNQLHDSRLKLKDKKFTLEMITKLQEILEKGIFSNIEVFQSLSESFSDKNINKLIQKIIKEESFTVDDAKKILPIVAQFIKETKDGIAQEKNILNSTLESLSKLQIVQQSERLNWIKQELDNVSKALALEKKPELLKKQSELLAHFTRIQIKLNTSADELAQRKLQRGGARDVMLKGFNVEEMLKKASELADKKFHIGKENCSSTCMKILNAGAPQEVAHLFDWPEVMTGETTPSNTFLSNPGSVHKSAKLVELAALGYPEAQQLIQDKKSETPDKAYFQKLNGIVNEVTVENDIIRPSFTKIVSFILRCLPILTKLYQNVFQSVKTLEKPTEGFYAKITKEIKGLNNDKYLIINQMTPTLAIHQMMTKLKLDKTNIPFFERDTLSLVERYILSIEAKESKTPEEEMALNQYKLIEAEREARIQTIEKSIIAGDEIKASLEKRSATPLEWNMSLQAKEEALVKEFQVAYLAISSQDPFSFLKPNFANKLHKTPSPKEQLNLIQTQMEKYPEGRTTKAMVACIQSFPILKEAFHLEPHLLTPEDIIQQSLNFIRVF